ncbi:MAG: hypothetical protein ABSH05_19615 [Bryobacteraceae bacterium]|jgi:hypothetical protein
MRDPHVESLRFRFTSSSTTFDAPPPVLVEKDDFRAELRDGVLTVQMKQDCASIDAARMVVAGFLRAWEIDVALRLGPEEFQFVYQDAHVVDRDPPPRGAPITSTIHATLHLDGTVVVHVTRREYPAPPQCFVASPDVETMWCRFQGYLKGREPLAAMAYFCLTVLTYRFPKGRTREAASQEYGIDTEVLSCLGDLSTNRGDPTSARKMIPGLPAHTPSEVAWLEAAMKRIIRRVAEHDAGGTGLPTITMTDLPRPVPEVAAVLK